MTWPDLAALELLVAINDHGSLSAGARAVSVAQPNASRTVARLERRLGLALIHRATSGASLTPEGLLVVEWARTVLESARRLEDGVVALRTATTENQQLRVMASQTVAEHLLPAWVAQWRSRHPDHGISVAVGNTSEVLAAVRAGNVDLGFIEGPQAPTGLNSSVVAHDDLVLAVPPSHPWAKRQRIDADELAAASLVTREPGSGTRVALQRALAPRSLQSPALELTSNAAVRISAAAGTAPAVLSRLALTDFLASRALVEVGVTNADLRRDLRAVWVGPRRLTHASAADLLEVAATSSA